MKLYRRDLEITPQDEMHLEIDHYLTPIEITEEEIADIIYHEFKHGTSGAFTVSADKSAATILSKLKGE